MAIIVITEREIWTCEPITPQNALIIAQHAKNLHDEIMRQVAAQNGNYAAAYEPRQPEQNGIEPQPEAQQAE